MRAPTFSHGSLLSFTMFISHIWLKLVCFPNSMSIVLSKDVIILWLELLQLLRNHILSCLTFWKYCYLDVFQVTLYAHCHIELLYWFHCRITIWCLLQFYKNNVLQNDLTLNPCKLFRSIFSNCHLKFIHMYICIYYVHMYACTYICMYVCGYVYMLRIYVRMYVCMYYVCTLLYVYG